MTLDIPDSRVFDWLGVDSNGVGYYLHPLNLVWSNDGPEHDLRIFGSVAKRLLEQPEHWAEIIQSASWRHTLVGCVCVMLVRPNDRFDDLLYRFEHGSFVSPQICMTMGIVYPDTTVDCLNAFLNNRKDGQREYKEIMSAQSVLARLGVPRSDPIKLDDLESFDRDDATIAERVVDHQWAFWSKHSGDAQYAA